MVAEKRQRKKTSPISANTIRFLFVCNILYIRHATPIQCMYIIAVCNGNNDYNHMHENDNNNEKKSMH